MKPGLYLHLFHGRDTLTEDMDDYAYEKYRQARVDAGTWRPFNQLSEILVHETETKSSSSGPGNNHSPSNTQVSDRSGDS